MKKKSNSNSQQIMSLVLVLAVLSVVLVYFFVYKDYTAKAKTMRDNNNELAQTVANLKYYYEHQAEYEETIKQLKTDITTVWECFPEKVLEEDEMMLAYNSSTKSELLAYTSIAMVEPEVIYSISADEMKALKASDSEEDTVVEAETMEIVKKETSYVASCDYPSLKTMIQDVIDSKGRNVIKNILFEKNTGLNVLEGTMEVAFYYIPSYGYEYKPVEMKEYTKGMEALFVLKEVVKEDEEEKDKE